MMQNIHQRFGKLTQMHQVFTL